MSNARRLIVLLAGISALALIMSGCVKPAPTAPTVAPIGGPTLQQQAVELKELALKQAQASWPASGQPYARQWAEGIGQAVMDTGAERLSDRRMAALRAAVSESARDVPQPPLHEHFAWVAAAAQYNWAPLVHLPDLTREQMLLMDRQVEDLAGHVAEQVKDTLTKLDPPIAQRAAAASADEFIRAAARDRANPSSLFLKRPLTPEQMRAVKRGFDASFSEHDKMTRFIIRDAKDPEKRIEVLVVRACSMMRAQITALTPEPQYPEDVLKLEKAYADAYMATRKLPGK